MRTVQFVGVLSLLAIGMDAAVGQQTAPPPEGSGALEEIVVTAAKREQSLQEVPISVAVTTEDTLEKAQIRDLIDLQSVVPSLKVQQLNAPGQTNFIIRGFGNGAGNDGIENSVGVFIDGVYRSRSASALDDLPDVERIEVLRGPQSTLFGKNVSAGAINIVTARPQSTFGASTEFGFGNYGLLEGRGWVTGPILDTLSFRLSGSATDRNGYLHNLTTGDDVNDRDRWSARADFLWKPLDSLAVRVIGDYSSIKETCCGVVSILNGPATQFIGAPAPFGLGFPVGDPAAKFNHDIIFNTDPVNRLIGKGVSAQADWDVGPAALTSITAYRQQTNQSFQDVDFTGADLANKYQPDDIKTFTQELRITSNGQGRINWLAGGFFEHEIVDTGVHTVYGNDIRAYADGLSGPVPGALLGALPPPLQAALAGHSNLYALELLQSLVTPGIVPGGTYFQAGQGISDFYKLYQNSYSFFGQTDFKVTDRFTLTGGLAYLHDQKRAVSDVVLEDPFSALNLQNVPQFAALGLPPGLYGPLGALQFFYGNTPNHAPVNFPNANESGELDGSKVTYTVRAAYDLGPVNAYLSYATGWKAGAFNLSSDSRPPDMNGVGRTASPENVTVYEGGLKAKFPGGFANLAVFDQAIKGFQSNAYTGTGYSLVNAGKESVRGFELDASYRPIRWLDLVTGVTYLDPKYDSFTRAPCVSYDAVRCPLDPATGLIPNFRDLSGTRPAGIPTWSVSSSVTLSQPLGWGFDGFIRGEYDYVSAVQLEDTTPPAVSTFGQKIVNASVGFTNAAHQFDVTVWARNLNNYNTLIATFPTVAQTGSYSAFPNEPRTFGMTLRKRF
jgi:iron complex outermembrane recepter protein